MAVDFIAVVVALAVAFLLRLTVVDVPQLWPVFLLLPFVSVAVFYIVGVYDMVVRFSTLEDNYALLKGVVLSSLVALVLLFLAQPEPNPRSIFIIYGLLLMAFCGGSRILWKGIVGENTNETGRPIAIYGAGELGRQVMQICRNGTQYRPVLWLDDDKKYHNRYLANARVLDPKHVTTPDLLKAHGVNTILMAIPNIGTGRMKEVLESLQSFNCSVKTLPSISDIMANRVNALDAKTLPLEELIGRQPVAPDITLMRKNITNKVVMVTGAGGSVGSELCRQILPLQPAALVLFDISEPAMYEIDSNLKAMIDEFPLEQGRPPVISMLGNVCFKEQLDFAIRKYSVQTLFHAAAYKHVPMVEMNPQPAIRTNVFGTRAAVEVAVENNIENFLLVSTDKAVRPTNVMGATKRIAEMVVQAQAAEAAKGGSATRISIVRFGNVIGSSGSVLPKFSAQIEAGGPLTVTHKDVVRYFMSIPEAAQLVIQASALAEGGDLFLLDMGQPVQIADLAKSLIYLHGKTPRDTENPHGDIEIVYTGLREGEKLFEELLIDDSAVSTTHPKISRAREGFIEWAKLEQILSQFAQTMETDPGNDMIEPLKAIVAGYKPNRNRPAKSLAELPAPVE
jgi:FlaA1/EpsC-like NDP-sugar epimerase